MGVLKADIAAFESMQTDLEKRHLKAWVVFHHGRFEGAFPDYDHAAEFAVDRFDCGPYLIRQVGAGPVYLGGGLTFRPASAHESGGI